MNIRTALNVLLIILIGYGLYYYFFIRPTPVAGASTTAGTRSDAESVATTTVITTPQEPVHTVNPRLSLPLDKDGKIVSPSSGLAVNYLSFYASELPFATCYKGRTISVSGITQNSYGNYTIHASSRAGC